MNTKRPVVPARNPHKVAALVAISMPENLKIQPSDGTITVTKYIGKRAAITVVANAELAQSYIHHANTFLSFSFFMNPLDG